MAKAPPTPLVDAHFHVFPLLAGITGARYVPTYSASLEQWRGVAQSCGITHGVLVQPSFLGTDNSLLLKALRSLPNCLRGVAVVAPHANKRELEAMHQAGVRGIRLNLSGRSHDYATWALHPETWDAVMSLGWHLELHTDTNGLPGVLKHVPSEIRVVIDHMARPASASLGDETIKSLRMRRKRAVFVKLSAPYRLEGISASELAKVLLHELGPSALLWGSDWPFTNHESQVNYQMLFSALDKWLEGIYLDNILSANPQKLYFC
ncbi:MAG: amidohydrolase [Betaproteobacteria bacterium]|nr:amidohydrolase [Betaproteobacteria bacterium]